MLTRYRIPGFAMSTRKLLAMLAILATAGCSSRQFGLASVGPQQDPWAAALVGSWALVEPAVGLGGAPAQSDTAVWDIEREGRLRHLRVRARAGEPVADEREIQLAWWWVEPGHGGDVTERVLCTSARPSRGRQCGRITFDTIATPGERPGARMTWRGLTFKSQHWVFMRRVPQAP